MNENDHGGPKDFEAAHAAIIARTLRWADEAAARQDYGEALAMDRDDTRPRSHSPS